MNVCGVRSMVSPCLSRRVPGRGKFGPIYLALLDHMIKGGARGLASADGQPEDSQDAEGLGHHDLLDDGSQLSELAPLEHEDSGQAGQHVDGSRERPDPQRQADAWIQRSDAWNPGLF